MLVVDADRVLTEFENTHSVALSVEYGELPVLAVALSYHSK